MNSDQKFTLTTTRIILILILLQIATISFLALNNENYTWDEASYIINGIELSKSELSPVLKEYIAFERHPLLSWIIAGMINIGLPAFSYKLISLISLILLILLIYKIGRDFYNRDVGLLAALLTTTIPTVIFLSAKVLSDIPSTFLFSLSLYLYYKGLEKKSYFLWGGFVGGISIMMKDMNFLLIPIMLVFWILFRRKINKAYFISSAAVAVLSILPYFIDNYLRWGNPLYRILTHVQMVNAGIGYQSVPILNHPMVWFLFLPILIGFPIFILFAISIYQEKKTKNSDPRFNFLCIWFFVPFLVFILNQKISPRLIGIFLVPVIIMGSRQLLMKKNWKILIGICLVVNAFPLAPLLMYDYITITTDQKELFTVINNTIPKNQTLESNASPPSLIALNTERITHFNLYPDSNETVQYYLFDNAYERYTKRTKLNQSEYDVLFKNERYTIYHKKKD